MVRWIRDIMEAMLLKARLSIDEEAWYGASTNTFTWHQHLILTTAIRMMKQVLEGIVGTLESNTWNLLYSLKSTALSQELGA